MTAPPEQHERYVTVSDLAGVLGIPAETILRLHAEGRIYGRRLPGTLSALVFRRSDVDAARDRLDQLTLQERPR